ncbi:MAG: hypothetical protein HRT74_14260, partial [Flavobacteriales bacterium]|nr:hypothetical protein [Flavobacteriales bacterium]
QPFDEEYYQLIKHDQQFEGAFIKIQSFNKSDGSTYEVTNFYDQNYALVNRLSAKKGKDQFTWMVNYNGQELVYKMTTAIQESTEKLRRAPHELVKKHWQERFKVLDADLKTAASKLSGTQGESWVKELQGNHFIDQRLAPLVKANHDEVMSKVNELQLRLEKIQFEYERQ